MPQSNAPALRQHVPSTAPLSAADQATHRAASYVRPARAADGDSDPNPDELLRRVHNPRSGLSEIGEGALHRLTAFADTVTAEQAEQIATEENLAWQQREHGLAA